MQTRKQAAPGPPPHGGRDSWAGERRVGGAIAVAVTVAGAAAPGGRGGRRPRPTPQIVGAGSQAAYGIVEQVGDLFNVANTCQQFVAFPSSQ